MGKYSKSNKKSIAASKADKSQNRSSAKIILTVVLIVAITVVLGISAGMFYLYNFDFNGTILENVYVAGVNVGNMTRAEAVAAVTAATENTYTKQTMRVKVLDTEVEISPEVSGASLNVSAAIWDAYKYGRRGFAEQQARDREDAANGGIVVDISGHLQLKKSGIEDVLSAFAEHYSSSLTQSSYEVTGSGETLTLVVTLGVPEYGLNPDKLLNQVLAAYSANTFFVEGECGMIEPDPIDLNKIRETHAIAPVNATYSETFEVIKGSNGYTLDIDKAQQLLDDAGYGNTVEIPFTAVAPEVTETELSERLYRDVLGSHTASQSSSSNRETNLRLACEAINGVILYPGDVFSYNQTLGERTEEKGYKYGASYSGGETISTIGGGICQVSSTLYYCALQADMEIVVREEHSYAPGYVPLGMDATVSWGYLDFSFRNNHDYPIRIEATADGGSTTIRLMGTDTKDYYVKMEYVVTAYYKYDTVYETMKADNPKGYKDGDYIVSPCSGYDVVTYRCKYKKGTDELISRELEDKSSFTKRDAVICKIEGASPDDGTTPDTTQPGIGNGGVTDSGGELPD